MTKELMNVVSVLEEKAGKTWIEEFRNVDSGEELMEKAGKYGIELTPEMAEEGIALLKGNTTAELSEEELSGIAGGKFYC